jgi:RimJ/RimL family protein N-acetyltransferase
MNVPARRALGKVVGLVKTIVLTLYRRQRVIVLAASPVRHALPDPIHGLELKRFLAVEPDDPVGRLRSSVDRWNKEGFDRRRRLRDVCYAVLDGSRCVHYSWVTRSVRDIEEIGYVADIGESNAWVYDAVTDAEYRGRGIFPWALQHIVTDVMGEASTVWIDVHDDNRSSTRAIKKAGFVEVAILQATRILFSTKRERQLLRDDALADTLTAFGPRWPTTRQLDRHVQA